MVPQNHLPLLFNPLLNSLFNNPYHNKPPIKNTIQQISINHNEFTILVPPSFVLQVAYDPSTNGTTKAFLGEMSYNNEDFIQSHIIKSHQPSFTSNWTQGGNSTKNQSVVYYTLNGKQVLIKNGMIFTGRGFKKSLRLSVLGMGYFESFADYLPKGSKYMLIYIEDSLIGSNYLNMIDYIDPKISSFIPTIDPMVKEANSTAKNDDTFTFEMLLRSFPLLSKAVSEKYYKLFHHNNQIYYELRTPTRKTLAFIKQEFHKMVDDAYTIISESINQNNPESEKAYHLLKNVILTNPEIDLNRLVYEYVEMNMYDKIWSQLIYQFNYSNDDKPQYDIEAIKTLTPHKYSQLSCLCLNQLDIPIEEPWNINIILRRVSLAIESFTKLDDTSITSSSAKRKIISDTINILTNDNLPSDTNEDLDEKTPHENLIIDADTLVGMLIMVVVHSKIDNLEAHLYYIKSFTSVDGTNDGYFNYILSNLDAVIFHLSSDDTDSHFKDLIKSSSDNYELWSCIQRQDIDTLSKLLDEIDGGDLNQTHFLKSRNINGESCLMFAIKAKNYEIFKLLIDTNERWFSIDDLLFDKNTNTGQNLLMVSLNEEVREISRKLVDIIITNTSLEEQYAYFHSIDTSGRSVGHYIFHDLKLMTEIGHLINWELKDYNSHTPLFTICRCYDHNDYDELIRTGFTCFYNKNKSCDINFDNHIDKNGNTLLHIILKGLPQAELLNKPINVNQFNNKSMSPLTLYVKYNRVSNLHELLKSPKLDFLAEEPKNFYSVFDYLSFSASKPTSKVEEFKKIEADIYNYTFKNFAPKCASVSSLSEGLIPNSDDLKMFATNARFDNNIKDWVIFFRIDDTRTQFSIHENLTKLKQIIQSFELLNPFMAFPNKETVFMNFQPKTQTVPSYSKYRINRFIETLNLYFAGLRFYSSTSLPELYSLFGNNSGLDMMKEVIKSQDHVKQQLGEVKLTSNQIYEIETFLTYSMTDLQEYGRIISKLGKLFTVWELKKSDQTVVIDILLHKFINTEYVLPGLKLKSKLYGEHNRIDSSYFKLNNFCQWLEISNIELLKKIDHLLNNLKTWKGVYEKIRTINNELVKYENKVHPSTDHDHAEHPHSESVDPEHHDPDNHPDSNEQNHHPDSIETEHHQPETPDTESSFFSFGIENKKSRYKRLLLNKSDEIKTIMQLNKDIKLDHESIALEISNFLKYKSTFLNFGFKQFIQYDLIHLKQRKYQLQKILSSLYRP